MGEYDADEKERVELRLKKSMLSQLRDQFPNCNSDQERIIIAVSTMLNRDDPATPGDVHYEVRQAIENELESVYPKEVIQRLDAIEEKLDD